MNFPQPENKLSHSSYSILQLNNLVRSLLRAEFPENIWIIGEIQGYRSERGRKHIYFELVEKHPDRDEIVAKVRAIIFSGRKDIIFRKLRAATGNFEFKNDIEVRVLCEVNLHPATGQYSVIINDIDPIFTLGKVALNRKKIIDSLIQRKLFDRNKHSELSLLPLTVGLVTAQDSAAYHDFINELTQSGYGFSVLFYDAHMQGKQVEQDIVNALTYFSKNLNIGIDAIVITRGGGSKADLSWFDNEKIAEAIALSTIPVITALGHQIDESIADLVSHTSLKTPTKAAQFLVEKVQVQHELLRSVQEKIYQNAINLTTRALQLLERSVYQVDTIITQFFRSHREGLVEMLSLLTTTTKHLLFQRQREHSDIVRSLPVYISRFFQEKTKQLRFIKDKVKLLDPKEVMRRGYSLSRINGKVVKTFHDIKPDDIMDTIFYEGGVISRVEKVRSE